MADNEAANAGLPSEATAAEAEANVKETQEPSLLYGNEDDFTKAAIEAALAEERGEAEVAAEEASEEPEAAEEEAEAKAERPEHIPEKFWDAEKGMVNTEAMAKAYTELERKQSKPKADAKDAKPEAEAEGDEDSTEAEASDTSEETIQEVLNAKEFTEEFSKTGDLSKESRGKAVDRLKAVFGDDAKDMVDGYVEGLQLRTDKVLADLKGIVGGADAYQQLAAWAMENLSEQERTAFDKEVTASVDRAKLAIRELNLKYKEAGGAEDIPELTHGKGKGGVDGSAYTDREEIVKDMSDKRYDTDPAYRRKVDAKIARSTGG